MTEPLIVLELSTCEHSFNATCVFATNYVWGENYFPQVEWDWTKYLDASGTFYIRVTAPIATVTFSFQIQFKADGSMNSGKHAFHAFMTNVPPPNAIFDRLTQTALQTFGTVKNFNTQTYFVKFCGSDFPKNANKTTMIGSVVSNSNRPMSRFNLYACTSAFGSKCGTNSYEFVDLTASSVAQVIIPHSPQFNGSQGVSFVVYGLGSESDALNQYFFAIKLNSS